MNVILYNNSSPPNVVTKSIGSGVTIEGVQFYEGDSLNVENPRLIIDLSNVTGMSQDADNFVKFNYLKIPKFDRYYYVTNVSASGGLIDIQCEVDALMSFSRDIYGSNQYVVRSQSHRNRYIVDGMLPIHSQSAYEIKILDDAADVYDRNCNFVVLETTGKGGTPS